MIGFSLIFWPWRFLAAQLNRRIALEVDRLLQQLFYFSDTIIYAFGIESVNFVGRFEISEQDVAGNRTGILRIQLVYILLSKKEMAEVEHFQIRL